MKTIKCLHLYYDLLNLYGETGNITALVGAFAKQNVKLSVDNLTIKDEIDFSKYDIIYLGMGNEAYLELARKDILTREKEIKKVIKEKTFIVTGNALDLFGNKLDEKVCLGIFDFDSYTLDKRLSSEVNGHFDFLDKPFIGFQNRITDAKIKENSFIKLDNSTDGIHINNFYGTHFIGPVLIRNPYLTDKIVKDILEKNNIEYKEILDTPDYKAYEEYLKNFNIN